LTCCQRATPEEVEDDPDAYNCSACPWRAWQERLGDDNREALLVYGLLASRVVRDLRLTDLVFEGLGLTKTRADVLALLDRLAVIHESRQPISPEDLGIPDGGA
jgi:hypothetical protein